MIKKIAIANFKRFDNLETDIEKVNTLISTNGAGKTSFLQALRWALLGTFDKSYVRHDGPTSVEVTFESGTVIHRSYDGEKQIVKVNGSASTQKAANQIVLESELHCSYDVASAMFDSKDFENYSNDIEAFRTFLLSFLPVKLRKETFFKFIKETLGRDFNPDEETFFSEQFSKDEYVIEDIDSYYKKFYDERKEINKTVKDLKPKATFDKNTLPKETKEELSESYASICASEKTASDYKKLLDAYNNSVEQNKKALERKSQLEEKLKAYSNLKKPEKSMEILQSEKQQLMADYEEQAKSLAKSDAELAQSKKAYMGFSQETCPYMPSFKCPVDHEMIKAQIIEEAKKQRACSDQHEQMMNVVSEKIKAKDAEINEYNSIINQLTKAESLQEELSHLIIPEILEKPLEIKAEDVASKKAEIETKLSLYTQYEDSLLHHAEYVEAAKKADLLDLTVKLFSEKGMKTVILKQVLKPVEDIVNKKAALVDKNYEFRLINDDGFNPEFKINNGFVPFSSLSSGEFIIMCYILMSAINQITRCGICVLDNLDKLDKNNTAVLLKLVKDDAYDNVFLAGVNHSELDKNKELSGNRII